jgi:hypothetical protein
MNFRLVLFLSFVASLVFGSSAHANCARPALAQQKRDVATIQKLETAWSMAFLTGDTEFESCLLTPDFLEIRSNGALNHLSDELALAEKNKGKTVSNPDLPPVKVQLHGNVAVAYGLSPEKLIDGKPHRSYFADYYVWQNGGWHVYFAQQTTFAL